MGAIFRLPPWIEEPPALIARLRAGNVTNLAIDADGTTDYLSCDFSGPIALWLGGEGRGLPAETTATLDGSVRVPMRRGVESLSVGAAAAVVLFEAARQRGKLSLPA
jgi:tRNA G18 (ribose-2'-O)-methylase SpoU